MSTPIARNKRGRFDYEILEKVEAGMCLLGTEVKSLRDRHVSFTDSYARVIGDQVFLYNLHIKPYSQATETFNHDPTRRRKLLLHRSQIRRLSSKLNEQGLTLVPLAIYFSDRGYAKVEVGICRGRKRFDKRERIKRREADREIAKAKSHRRR